MKDVSCTYILFLILFTYISFSHLESLYCRPVLHKLNLKQSISILEESLLQTHDDELRGLEILAYHESDVLCVGEIKRRVDLIQNVYGGWLVLKKSKN